MLHFRDSVQYPCYISEIVYISTLNTNHVELSKKMLNAGKHVLCEKPMAMNYKQAKEVLDLAKEKQLLFIEVWTELKDYCKIDAS